jgi:hypothetical protein
MYCGIKLGWDYKKRTVAISMPGYITKKLQEYKHVHWIKSQHCPYSAEPKQFGSKAHWPLPGNKLKLLDDRGKKRIQKTVGSILHYARAVDMTVLMALNTITMSQAHPTKNGMTCCVQLLGYLAMHADAKNRFYALDMIMNIHLDATYLSESTACSRTCCHFFMGWKPVDGQPIKLNGAFYLNSVFSNLLWHQLRKLLLAPSSTIAKTESFFARPYSIWGTPNQRRLYIATMQRQSVLVITLSSINDCVQ